MDQTAGRLRDDLKQLIAAGQFADRHAFDAYLESRGISLHRCGADYVTIATSARDRARIYLPQSLHLGLDQLRRRRDGTATYLAGVVPTPLTVFTVYMIVAAAPDGEMAGYVGSSSLVRHRLAEHFHGRDGTSRDLANWTHRHRAKAFARAVVCTNTRGGAIQLEGCLTIELERQGWFLPGVSQWGAARRIGSMMSKSFRNAEISWAPPVFDDVLTWTPISHFKFYA